MKTTFEDLPNELISIVFEFLPIVELFRGFFQVQRRFDEILRSIFHRFDLIFANENEIEYFRKKILPNVDFLRIESISIDDVDDRLVLIRNFSNLRSVKIERFRSEIFDDFVETILPTLKNLTRLFLHTEFEIVPNKINRLTKLLFSNELSSLNFCHLALENFDEIRFDHLDLSCRNPTLKILILDQWCRLRDFHRLLRHIPAIERLTVRLFNSGHVE